MDTSSYYDVWEALTAVNAICVRRGKSGVAYDIGESPEC